MKKLITILSLALLSATNVNAQCSALFISMPNAANNGNVTFVDSVMLLAGSNWNYQWSFGDGTAGWGNMVTHNYTSSGTYYVCLIVTDTLSTVTCTYCDSVTVINSAAPSCNANFVVSDSNAFVLITDLSTGTGLNYLWNFGDGTTSTTSGFQTHTYASTGTFTICLTVTNTAATCTDTYCDTIIISSCSGSYYYSTDTTGLIATFTSFVSGTADTYLWDFGDGYTSTLANPIHTYATTGTYFVCLDVTSSTDVTCYYSYCDYVYCNPFSPCNANFTIVQDTANLFNYWVYNNAFGTSGSTLSYFWDFGDSTSSTLAYPTHTYLWSNPVQLCLTITATTFLGTTCTATHCDSINPGHGVNQVTTINVINPATIGIGEHKKLQNTLENYPNPFSSITNISYSLHQNSKVEIYVLDMLGNKVAVIESGNKTAGNYKNNFNASEISAGIYFLQMKTDNALTTRKMIITK